MGYPLKLVTCRSHRFVRWDQPGGERFNIEVNDNGTDTPPDDYYRQGGYAITPDEEKDFCFLRSCTPRMELADFLAQRGREPAVVLGLFVARISTLLMIADC